MIKNLPAIVILMIFIFACDKKSSLPSNNVQAPSLNFSPGTTVSTPTYADEQNISTASNPVSYPAVSLERKSPSFSVDSIRPIGGCGCTYWRNGDKNDIVFVSDFDDHTYMKINGQGLKLISDKNTYKSPGVVVVDQTEIVSSGEEGSTRKGELQVTKGEEAILIQVDGQCGC